MSPEAPTASVAPAIARLSAGKGVLFLIVGPSGAGKDTLITWLRRRSADQAILFVRRVVTRDADQAVEDHETLDPADFAHAEAARKFAVTWEAHGLRYGLPVVLQDHLAEGGMAVANGSRQALPVLRRAFANMVIVNLQVTPGELMRRLATRGRETQAEIAGRLARRDLSPDWREDTVHLDNSGLIETAGERLVALIAAAERQTTGASSSATPSRKGFQ